jgi:transcriptional regulator PpsR
MRISADVLKQLDEETVSALVGLGADLVIVIDGATVVRKIYMPDPQLREYLLANLPGKRLRDVVTEESVEKIDRMIAGEKAGAAGRGFQVNVPLEGGDDVPFELHVFEDKVLPYRLVIGHDMRQQMRQQQRLVHAQMEMESDYRELQEAEARYRTAFQVSSVALLMVDGKGKTVLDVNPAAAALLSGTAGAIAGKPLRELFRREFRDQLVDALSEARHSGVAVNLDDLVTARGEPVSASIRSYREKGLTNLIVTLRPAAQNDETGHRLGEPAGSRAMIDIASFPEAAVQTDLGGRIIAANDIFLDIVHAPSPGQVIGSNVSTWFGNSAIDIQVLFSRVAEEHMVRGFTSTLRDNLLGERPVLLSARRHPENEIIQIIVLSQPVTARKAAVAPLGAPQRADGFAHLVGKVPMKDLIRESLDVIEKICIEAALDQTNNNRASAAELLGLSRQSLYIKLRRHGLEDYLANE